MDFPSAEINSISVPFIVRSWSFLAPRTACDPPANESSYRSLLHVSFHKNGPSSLYPFAVLIRFFCESRAWHRPPFLHELCNANDMPCSNYRCWARGRRFLRQTSISSRSVRKVSQLPRLPAAIASHLPEPRPEFQSRFTSPRVTSPDHQSQCHRIKNIHPGILTHPGTPLGR